MEQNPHNIEISLIMKDSLYFALYMFLYVAYN